MNNLTGDALDAAWERVRAKGGAPGVDGLTVEAFGAEAAYHLGALEHDLASGTYCPQPYRTVSVQKSDGGRRRLVIATVRDRVAQRAAADAMLPLVEPCLLPCSFAYRRGIRVQKSVFECWLDDEQRRELFAQLESVLDKARDSVRWYTICADCRQAAASHGRTEIRENRSYYIV